MRVLWASGMFFLLLTIANAAHCGAHSLASASALIWFGLLFCSGKCGLRLETFPSRGPPVQGERMGKCRPSTILPVSALLQALRHKDVVHCAVLGSLKRNPTYFCMSLFP